MDVYTRGIWSEDSSVPDDYSISSATGLMYEGFESGLDEKIGQTHFYNIELYTAKDCETAKYRYFANLSLMNSGTCVLVPDYISVLMLIKEFMPIIEIDMKVEAHRAAMEEHKWNAKLMKDEHGFKCECDLS